MKNRKNRKNRPFRRPILGEGLESRYLLSAVGFVTRELFESDVSVPVSVYTADVDGDGDVDVLSASAEDNKIAWYENADGAGTFGQQQVITTEALQAASVYAADVDGDGDVDVLSASSRSLSWFGFDAQIAWYENTDGKGTFGEQRVIATQAGGAESVYAADVDGDGDLDVLFAGDDRIAWCENTDGKGTFGEQQVIATRAPDVSSVYAADVDGDGDVDVLSASSSVSSEDGQIAWYENTDGQGTFGEQQVIATNRARFFHAADMDGDGDLDVLAPGFRETFIGGNMIVWYENTDGQGSFGDQQVITETYNRARSVYAADVDGDGDMDVLSAFGDRSNLGEQVVEKFAWFENTDGRGTFAQQVVISEPVDGFVSFVHAADVDGDGDVDLLSASKWDDKITWFENTDSAGTFAEQPPLTEQSPADNASWVYAADVDGDHDVDMFSASWGKIAWYENIDGEGRYGEQQVITAEVGRQTSVHVADVDGDGDLDVLSASGDKVAWYQNKDGEGTFGEQRVISAEANGVSSVYAADMDGDGDLDVLCGYLWDDKIAWYENTDGKGTFGDQQVISSESDVHTANSVHAADVDGDGDMDVLSESSGEIAWYENTDGEGTFGEPLVITAEVDRAGVYAADMDGDGDLDVLSAFFVWYENTDGKGTFGEQHVIAAKDDGSLMYAEDVDGDGDVDVLSVSADEDKIAWYENTDARGTFGPQQLITTEVDRPWSVYATDVDGDGDVDVLSASWLDDKIAWYENRLAGDVDDDGEVSFADFRVLADNFGNTDAVWEDGDFDGNGEVLFSDFLILANNFGQTRPGAVPASLAESGTTTHGREVFTTSGRAADELFAQFDDELDLDKIR